MCICRMWRACITAIRTSSRGGQRQRIMIAMALILRPQLLIADEPTTALDVTTQKQILALIRELREEQGTAVLFITHDMGVVAEIADDVTVLRLGEIEETRPVDALLRDPKTAYSRALLQAVPSLIPRPARKLNDRPIVLQTTGLGKTYESSGLFRKGRSVVAAKDVNSHAAPGADARDRRRIGLRKIHRWRAASCG